MTRFLLIRHAPHADVGVRLTGRNPAAVLTPEGRALAGRLAARLAGEGLAAVHASPQTRTLETADAVAAACGLAVAETPLLDEIDFGRWAGRRFDELERDPDWRRWNAARDSARPPGGEMMADAQARAVAHVGIVAGRMPDAAVALVTHADIIRALACRALGLPLGRLLAFDVDPASVTRLSVAGGEWRLNSLNESPAA